MRGLSPVATEAGALRRLEAEMEQFGVNDVEFRHQGMADAAIMGRQVQGAVGRRIGDRRKR